MSPFIEAQGARLVGGEQGLQLVLFLLRALPGIKRKYGCLLSPKPAPALLTPSHSLPRAHVWYHTHTHHPFWRRHLKKPGTSVNRPDFMPVAQRRLPELDLQASLAASVPKEGCRETMQGKQGCRALSKGHFTQHVRPGETRLKIHIQGNCSWEERPPKAGRRVGGREEGGSQCPCGCLKLRVF